jgi:carbamoyltransferase
MSNSKRKILLGLTTGIHDTSASLVIDGKIVAASEEERFDRIKHSGAFPINALKFCLKQGKVEDINEIDEICIGMKWMTRAIERLKMRFTLKSWRLLKQSIRNFQEDRERTKKVYQILRKELGYKGKIKFYDHYDCHAAVCYYPSSFESAAVLIIDGAGEKASARIYSVKGTKFEKLFQKNYPNSIGRFYGWMTDYLGFKIECDEGKVMGLASFGNDVYLDKMRKVLSVKENGEYDLDVSYFEFHKNNKKGVSDKFIEVFGQKRKKGEEITDRHKNIAKAVQIVTDEAVLGMAKLAKELTGEKKLCISGGVALNSVANGKIIEAGLFEDVYIYPASGDDGTGLGAALLLHYSKLCKKVFYKENQSPYLGYEANENKILEAMNKFKLNFSKSENIAQEVAKLLAENRIIGVYSGKMEFGPRALGNRSILADPRKAENKDLVNNKIKFRESFRPFAPSILEEIADDFFEMYGMKSPYMILTLKTKEDKKKIIPAVVHVDGTARVQTVNKKQNEKYWDIINEFYKLTGVPVVLNTSFNRAGEPIVNTPEEAIAAFLGSALDVLVLGDYLILK